MVKVKLPREVADAIERLRNDGYSEYQIAWNVCNVKYPHRDLSKLDGLNGDTILRALYIGYEVESTPEDKVKEYYEQQVNVLSKDQFKQDNTPYAIRMVLDLLEIQIKGVNT